MKTAVFLLLVSAAWSQPLRVYSEFAKIDPSGKVTAPAEPREILSPAIVRNGYSSFQVVVDVPEGTSFQLYVAQNPEHAVDVTLYREAGERLQPVDQPAGGSGPQVFWMDLWTARDAPVARIKVEPQLHVNNDWVIYPMEARVVAATVPDNPPQSMDLSTSTQIMKYHFCPRRDVIVEMETSSSDLTWFKEWRNASQDVALARTLPKEEIQGLLGCGEPISRNPESYLRIRDYLLRSH